MFVQNSVIANKRQAAPKTNKAHRATIHAFVSEAEKQKKAPTRARNFTEKEQKSQKSAIRLELSYGRIIMWVLTLGLIGFIYLAHVRKTDLLLEERNQVRIEHENARHQLQELQRDYERVISPSSVYQQATSEGYKAAQVDDPVLKVD